MFMDLTQVKTTWKPSIFPCFEVHQVTLFLLEGCTRFHSIPYYSLSVSIPSSFVINRGTILFISQALIARKVMLNTFQTLNFSHFSFIFLKCFDPKSWVFKLSWSSLKLISLRSRQEVQWITQIKLSFRGKSSHFVHVICSLVLNDLKGPHAVLNMLMLTVFLFSIGWFFKLVYFLISFLKLVWFSLSFGCLSLNKFSWWIWLDLQWKDEHNGGNLSVSIVHMEKHKYLKFYGLFHGWRLKMMTHHH